MEIRQEEEMRNAKSNVAMRPSRGEFGLTIWKTLVTCNRKTAGDVQS